MKKAIIATLGVLVVVALALLANPTTRDEIHWLWTTHKEETASYESYVRTWPQGRHAAEATARHDEHGWSDAQNANTVEGFERYMQLHGGGEHVGEAKDSIEALHWQEATTANTVEGFERYVQLHGEGKHVGEAKDNIESLHWQEETTANTVEGFERYVQFHGEGKHAGEARDNIELLHWQKASTVNTVEGFERYIQLHAEGKHAGEARDSIESLHWRQATAANTIRSYRAYVSAHPQGRFAQEAETKASALHTDDAPYETALRSGTEAPLRQFLSDFPGHRKEPDAQQAIKDITEGRDIVEFLREKKIEIEAQGSGIQSVGVRIRKLVPYPITVRVPVGSYFVSSRQSAQNMVTTAESKVRLTGDDWRRVSVSAACANRPRDIPGSDDTFTVQRSPHQEELARLMPVLNKAGVGYATRQAAVWIVTDNADYSDLGILVSRSHFALLGTRQINAYESARAMKICDDAGIDVKRKAIWRDRQTILSTLEDEELKKWLEDQE